MSAGRNARPAHCEQGTGEGEASSAHCFTTKPGRDSARGYASAQCAPLGRVISNEM